MICTHSAIIIVTLKELVVRPQRASVAVQVFWPIKIFLLSAVGGIFRLMCLPDTLVSASPLPWAKDQALHRSSPSLVSEAAKRNGSSTRRGRKGPTGKKKQTNKTTQHLWYAISVILLYAKAKKP